jgi:hypothetical protein
VVDGSVKNLGQAACPSLDGRHRLAFACSGTVRCVTPAPWSGTSLPQVFDTPLDGPADAQFSTRHVAAERVR